MTTFNPSEDQEHFEARPRSYSQDAVRPDQELLETKTISCREAMSQFVCHQQSQFNDDTESEEDEDEFDDADPTHLQPQKLSPKKKIQILQNALDGPSLSLYQKYLKWFAQHQIGDSSCLIKPQSQTITQTEAETMVTCITKQNSSGEDNNDINESNEKTMDLDYLLNDCRHLKKQLFS